MKSELSELVLTCGSWQEAQAVADALLDKKLVSCVEMLEVDSKYRWKGQIDEAKEIKLIMLGHSKNFNKIESEVAKLHSYDTFVSQSLPVAKVNEKASKWLAE